MKKVFLGIIVSGLVLFLAGCGKKGTITCTLEVNDELLAEFSVPKQEVIVEYKGSKVTKATGNSIYETADQAKAVYDSMVEIANEDKAPVNFKLEGNKITNMATTDDILNLTITDDAKGSQKDKVINGLKAQGFICK